MKRLWLAWRSPRGTIRRWLVLTLVLTLVAGACDSTTVPPTAPATQVVSAVEISPAGGLIAGVGGTRQLTAVPMTAGGEALSGDVTWASSDPAVVSVDATGTVTAHAVGHATVTATAGGSVTQSTEILVAEPVDGAILITDAQIVGDPTPVDPAPEGSFPFEAVLRGVEGIAEGAIVINTETKPVLGQVVAATAEGDDTRVRLVLLPVGRMFSKFLWRDTVDLAEGPYEVPDEVGASFEVVQEGTTFSFTPRAGATSSIDRPVEDEVRTVAPASWGQQHGDPVATAADVSPLPPFGKCGEDEEEEDGDDPPPMPVSLSVPPALTFGVEGDLTREVTETATTYELEASSDITFQLALELKAAIERSWTCKLTFFTKRFRLPPIGILLALVGGDINFGVGFTLGGEATLASLKVGGKVEFEPSFAGLITCPNAGDCTFRREETPESHGKFTPIWEVPSLGQARVEPKLELFAFAELDAGCADFEACQFLAIAAKAGLELGASLTLEGLQIENTDADDGRSKYGLAFKAEFGPGIKLGDFLEYLGIESAVPLKLEFELPLGESPKGTVRADKARYLPGELVKVKVRLDQASTVFPFSVGVYNVEGVAIVRRDGLSVEVLHEVAGDGQTEFDIEFAATHLLDAGDLYAFVLTKLLPLDPPKLEIGKAAVPIIWTFDTGLQGWRAGGIGRRSETRPWGEAAWRETPGGGAARISGVGQPSVVNGWILRDIAVPADARKLVFKASADYGHAHSDSQLLVVVQVDGQYIELHRAIYTNTTNSLQYTTVELDISRFAGQNVRLIFEQNDDGEGQHEHIYLDDIEIRFGEE